VERKKRQRYGNEFRRQAVERMNACDNIVALAREPGVGRPLLGAAVGAVVFVAIRGHVFGDLIIYEKLEKNPAMMIFYVWLAGLFAKTLLDLLLDLTKKYFASRILSGRYRQEPSSRSY
jgi:hypothetical protein